MMLEGKVAVITGGTRGIGLETAKVFLENGAKVAIFGSRKESVEKALGELRAGSAGGVGSEAKILAEIGDMENVCGLWPDLGSYEEIEKTLQKVRKKWGRLDIMVNNAGRSAKESIFDTTVADFDEIMRLNVNAVFYGAKAAAVMMREQGGGVILNTSSMVSIYGQPAGVGYPTSKFAVNGLTKSLARELAPYGIRVNAVAPGITRTDMVAGLPEEMIAPLIKTIPLGRMAEPRDIANAFLYLASDLAGYVTGEILSVDGCARS